MTDENAENNVPDEEINDVSSCEAEDVSGAESGDGQPSAKEPLTREEELMAENKALNDKYLLLAADFENFRKRSAKESSERTERAVEHLAVELLEVVDNIDRALGSDESALREGVLQIQKILVKILNNHSISPIESLKEQFDPNKHEAIAYVPSECDEGTVIDEIIRGYCMKDKVIRCAKVAVSKGKQEE